MAPFMRQKLLGEANPYFIAGEPASCPSPTRGRFAYDFCDMARTTPLAKMYTLGCEFVPYPTHAGGLRYHGMSPVLSQLYHDRLLDEARAVVQTDVFDFAVKFAKSEGVLPAPESVHAIHFGIEEALKCRDTGEAKTILIGLSGTGYFDMNTYSQHMDHTMTDRMSTDEELEPGFTSLPKIPGIQE
jgi:tryptophan synthase beta chain